MSLRDNELFDDFLVTQIKRRNLLDFIQHFVFRCFFSFAFFPLSEVRRLYLNFRELLEFFVSANHT